MKMFIPDASCSCTVYARTNFEPGVSRMRLKHGARIAGFGPDEPVMITTCRLPDGLFNMLGSESNSG